MSLRLIATFEQQIGVSDDVVITKAVERLEYAFEDQVIR